MGNSWVKSKLPPLASHYPPCCLLCTHPCGSPVAAPLYQETGSRPLSFQSMLLHVSYMYQLLDDSCMLLVDDSYSYNRNSLH